MHGQTGSVLQVAPPYQPIFRELLIDADAIFHHELIKPWRSLADRENCVLEATLQDGSRLKWHVKRYQPPRGAATAADDEIRGHAALVAEQIPTAELVAHGTLADRRSFVIFEDLAGYTPADKLIESGHPFESILMATSNLASKLHRAGLHHRDLYLCHFMVKPDPQNLDIRLIDPARVKRLPGFFFRERWIVKDLAQFWYSTLSLPITDQQRAAWLKRYAEERHLPASEPLRRKIDKKVAWIARHDAQLRKAQPNRNVSIPQS